jgi:hypothetical protein
MPAGRQANVKIQMPKGTSKWKNGRMEHWVERKVFSISTVIPSFRHSIIPEEA